MRNLFCNKLMKLQVSMKLNCPQLKVNWNVNKTQTKFSLRKFSNLKFSSIWSRKTFRTLMQWSFCKIKLRSWLLRLKRRTALSMNLCISSSLTRNWKSKESSKTKTIKVMCSLCRNNWLLREKLIYSSSKNSKSKFKTSRLSRIKSQLQMLKTKTLWLLILSRKKETSNQKAWWILLKIWRKILTMKK